MPPKIDLPTLAAKRDNSARSLYDLFEEFQALIEVQPEFGAIQNVYQQIESKYRGLKKQIETIREKIIDNAVSPEESIVAENDQINAKVKADFLKCTQSYAIYQKKCISEEQFKMNHSNEELTKGLESMNKALQKMVTTLSNGKGKSSQNHGLEKLPVPTWDGDRKSYLTWKNEFIHCMNKYEQDDDEQLQRFRKALPKPSFWSNQVKYCKTIAQGWEILDVEFGNKRKLMDELLRDITNIKPVKSDANSFSRFAAKILSFSNNMEQNGCSIMKSSEAPFVMSQLLSKLESQDNVDFGREMSRSKCEENIPNLIEWLNQEATLRSRGKPSFHGNDAERQRLQPKKVQTHAVNSETSDESCPMGCKAKHFLHQCPQYLDSTVNQRWEVVKKHRRCRKCLKNHHTSNCYNEDGITCDKCDKGHHPSLHNDRPPKKSSSNAEASSSNSNGTSQVVNNSNQGNAKIPGMCPVQKVKIKDKDGNHIEALAMLDSGSNTSLISKSLKNKLDINGPKTHLTMNLAGGKKKSEESELVNINIVSPFDESIEKCIPVYTVNKPCSPAKTISKNTVNNYAHLREISNKLYLAGGTIDLLIGTDFGDAFIDVHVIQGNVGEPIAKRNCFGWYIIGQLTDEVNHVSINSVDVGTVSAVEDIKILLTQDVLGVKPTSLCSCKDETLKENKFIKSISESTEIVDGRVQVRMPWKDSGPPTESNYQIAYNRMISFEKTINRKNCSDVIQEEIDKLLEQEFVVEIPPENVNHDTPEWYLPLHAVFTPERSTQVRLVFDASAKGPNGTSLNDHLEKGPNYINSLPDVLMAWRWDDIAYTGDIRKMFNQVKIHPDDQIFHRFLWRTKTTEQPKVYQWMRLNFGDKPAPDIATGAINTLARSEEAHYPEASKELLTHIYVDDIGGSKETETDAKKITNDIDAILQKGKFQIKAWHSNNKNIDQTEEETTTFLGHQWNKAQDTFTFKKREIITSVRNLTKRNCLACLSQVWDPIGLVMPVTIELRIDLQDLWSAGYTWDEILPDEIQIKWMKNIQVLNQLLSHEFKRKLKPDNAVGSPEIHGFCDAGEKAYGSVIFLRWKLTDGNYSCIPVMVKAFVAPLKRKSIPRLELMGCLSLTRLYATCNEALTFAHISDCKKVFWVDSQTVLSWVKTSPKKFKSFVSVRVAEIQETVDTLAFQYVQSQHNAADALTRGIPESQLTEWMDGPPFLHLPDENWPKFDASERKGDEPEADKEMMNSQQSSANCDATKKTKPGNPILEHLTKSCSSFQKTRKVLAYVKRFVHNAKGKNRHAGPITVEELRNAETQLFKWCQADLELERLDKKLMVKKDDQGVLRAHGRLENIRTLSPDLRNPIVLPHNHPLVTLLLKHQHETRGHCGYKSLMYESRRRFWIIGLRSKAKSLTRSCVTCRKLRQKPLTQLMGQIPSLRVNVNTPVFSHTAIDMFGPIQIRLNRKTLKEAQIAIFVCMTSRAVHLELCTDGTSDTFLMAFRRFASLRGHPQVCWSDCGTNFKGAQGYMHEVTQNWDIESIQSQLAEHKFQWKWNTPTASHMNGVVESLIKSVRQAINATCKNKPFTEEQWRTFLAEASYMVNSRPLYPSSDNIWEAPPITANDILIGQHVDPPQPLPEERVNPRHLVRSTQKRIEEFWNCWMKYFAPNLLPRNKWYRPRENLQIGDLVLQIDPKHRRTQWMLGIVTETYPGQDGLVRKVQIKTQSGEYSRPIHKLCLIASNQELATKK